MTTDANVASVSRLHAWLVAARPQTFPAAASPVVVGTALAVDRGTFAALPALAALAGALLIQVGTNFANDYYDAQMGADENNEGFTRVTQAGLIPPARVRAATFATFGLAMLVGLYLVAVGGVPVLVIGLASVLSGLTYTGGPYPLGYHGLGDLFVFVFFGLVAVAGTYYVQAVTAVEAASTVAGVPLAPPPETVTAAAVVAGAGVGALATAILVVNNVRDLETDRAVGKRTLAVRLGYTGSRVQYVMLLAVAYVVAGWFYVETGDPATLLPLLSLPYAALVARTVLRHADGEHLNPALERTGRLLAAYAALLGAGLVL